MTLPLILKKLWTPIYVAEGETMPLGYACTRFVPYDMAMKEPDPKGGIYTWREIAYPIPVSLALSLYHWCHWKVRWGFGLPPHCYMNRVFEVKTHCPDCGADIYAYPRLDRMPK